MTPSELQAREDMRRLQDIKQFLNETKDSEVLRPWAVAFFERQIKEVRKQIAKP
jgi:hypothetical protein